MKKASIGFVGVGRMGANIARRLADLGYPIAAVYDHHEGTATSLAVELGSVAAKTLPEVTAAADVIFTVVTDDAALRAIFAGDESLLKGAAGKVFAGRDEQTVAFAEVAGDRALAAMALDRARALY